MLRKRSRQHTVQSSGRKTVQHQGDPAPAVQMRDRHAVQAQVFRAGMKKWLDQGEPFIIGDYYRVRAVVIPVDHAYRSHAEPIEEEIRAKLKEVFRLIALR